MLFAMNRASAYYDFKVGGVFYNIVSASDKTCSVTRSDNQAEKYSGNVIIPEAVTYEGRTLSVVAICGFAFRGCSLLYSITIPNSVTEIGDYAFEGCTKLTIVKLSNSLTKIGDYAFSRCKAIKSITIPNSVTKISEAAFYHCI